MTGNADHRSRNGTSLRQVREPGSGEPVLPHGQSDAVDQHLTTATLRPGPRSGELGREAEAAAVMGATPVGRAWCSRDCG